MSSSFNIMPRNFSKASGGFTLVEVMVGMVIGLLGMLVMLQMVSFSENQKRVTSGSSDVQNAGAITLYGIERDIQQSGYGIDAQAVIGCSVTWTTALDNRTVTLPLAPVTINPAVTLPSDAHSDVLVVMYGSASSPEEGDILTSPSGAGDSYTVTTPTTFNLNDYVMAQYATRPATCSLGLTKIVTAAGSNPAKVTSNTGVTDILTANTSKNGFPTLFNLGATPVMRAYAVNNGNLTVCDYVSYDCAHYIGSDSAHWVPIAANIVSLKAQYGRDTNDVAGHMSGNVDTYDQATPPNAGSPYTTSCQWARISNVRLALVAEGAYEKSVINTAAPAWDGSTTVAANGVIPATVADPINLAAISNWANYHLKVFQTSVPIRNLLMQYDPTTGTISGC